MKTKTGLLLILFGLIIQSCNLNEDPYGFYSDNNFYGSAADAESAILYAYNTLNFIEYSRGIFYIGELTSETCDVKSGEGYGSQDLNNWTTDPNNETLTYFFKYCYIGINRANAVIENLQNATFDEDTRLSLLGEAHFLRAYHYFNLVRLYGRVPIQLEMVKTLVQTTPEMAADLNEIYDLILSDLKTADSYLDIKREIGRADKIAAEAYLAKAYLTMASAKESGAYMYDGISGEINALYDSAAVYAGKVLYDQDTYFMDPDYLSIYTVPTNVDTVSEEHIFIMSMDVSGTDEGEYSKIGMMFHPWVGGTPYYIKNPDGSLTYCTHGWEVFQTTDAFYKSYANNDLRKTELLVTEVYNEDGNLIGEKGTDFTYAFSRKYVDPNFSGQKSSVKPFLMRFSEVALIYSEAAGPTTEGYYWINEIRNRAGLDDLTSGLSTEAFRDSVLRERSWELAFEGKRLYDLRRKAIVTTTDPRATAAGITEQEAAFFDIPQMEVDLNPNVSGK